MSTVFLLNLLDLFKVLKKLKFHISIFEDVSGYGFSAGVRQISAFSNLGLPGT